MVIWQELFEYEQYPPGLPWGVCPGRSKHTERGRVWRDEIFSSESFTIFMTRPSTHTVVYCGSTALAAMCTTEYTLKYLRNKCTRFEMSCLEWFFRSPGGSFEKTMLIYADRFCRVRVISVGCRICYRTHRSVGYCGATVTELTEV